MERDARTRRVSRWELALWILGIILVAASVILTYGFTQMVYREQTNDAGGVDLGFFAAFEQTSEVFIAPFLTVGLMCIALAIFIRALDVNTRNRGERAPRMTPALAGSSSDAVPVVAESEAPGPPAQVPTTIPADYSAFMRPAADTADPDA
jgi:hypothetical protein